MWWEILFLLIGVEIVWFFDVFVVLFDVVKCFVECILNEKLEVFVCDIFDSEVFEDLLFSLDCLGIVMLLIFVMVFGIEFDVVVVVGV